MADRKSLFRLRTLPQAAVALAACGIGSAALAQAGDPVAGAVLYTQDVTFPGSGPLNCSDCHATGPLFRSFFESRGINEAGVLSRITSAINGNSGGMGVYSSLTPTQRADIAAYIMRGPSAPPPPPPFGGTPPPPPAPPTPTATPSQLMFSSTAVGATSAAAGVLFTNSSTATITFASPALVAVGGATSEFLATVPPGDTPMCGGSLGPGMSCSFGAQFRPAVAGTRSVTWVVSFTGGVAARTLTLEGMATAAATPAPTPSPTPSPGPAPAPAPAPTLAPEPASAANAPTSGGGGGTAWLSLCVLGVAAALRRRRAWKSMT